MLDARAALQRLIDERGEDYASLSRLIGRNAAYVQQYIKRGSPRVLAEADRCVFARYFGVSEEMVGGPGSEGEAHLTVLLPVPQLQVISSAGAGALNGDETTRSH